MGEIVFLIGVPDSTPGLLFKEFESRPDWKAFFGPLVPDLDLWVEHGDFIRDLPWAPPGVFTNYSTIPAGDLSPNRVFDSCLDLAEKEGCVGVAFEVSGFETQAREFVANWDLSLRKKRWAPPKWVSPKDFSFGDTLTSDRLISEKVFSFGLTEYSDCRFWNKNLDRMVLKTLLEQRKTLVEMGRLETENASLQKQIQNLQGVAQERAELVSTLHNECEKRLKIIESLNQDGPKSKIRRGLARFWS